MSRADFTKHQRAILEAFIRSRKSKRRIFLTALYRLAKGSVSTIIGATQVRQSFFSAYHPELASIRVQERELRKEFQQRMGDLRRAGYVRWQKQDGAWVCTLTKEGKSAVLKGLLEGVRQRTKPDGVLRLLVFDIPEEERRLRDFFRNMLRDFGFKYVQRSVWVSPYPVDAEVAQLVQLLKNSPFVRLYHCREVLLSSAWDFDKTHLV